MATFERDCARLGQQEYDVLIVGGGVTGAWLALHSLQCGFRTALIEKADYASQTSAASSKLLHGGIRYLQQMQFGKVRESAMERAHYLYAAPHLTKAVPFLVPTYRDFARSKFFLGCGMLVYHTLCLGENSVMESSELALPTARPISRTQLNQYCDLQDEPHTGGVLFYERHMVNSERMVLAILQTARQAGGDIYNYVAASELLHEDGAVVGVRATDELDASQFEIRSRLVINAAGPWIDSLNRCNGESDSDAGHPASITGYAIGSHIVTRKLSDHAIALTTRHQSETRIDRGGRHVFVIPWRGYSLIGTSYDEVEDLQGDLGIQAGHVDQLLEAVNQAMPTARLRHSDIISGYSGLYPLRTENIQGGLYQGSGEYQIIDHQQSDGRAGLITALGAKYTTGRKLSALTMNIARRYLQSDGAGSDQVHKQKLHNSQYASLQQFRASRQQKYADLFDVATIDHLVSHYGSEVDGLIDCVRQQATLSEPIVAGQPDIMGQVAWAIMHEQAHTLEDVLYRRTSLALLGISESEVRAVAAVMAQHLSWDTAEQDRQVQLVLATLHKTSQAIHASG